MQFNNQDEVQAIKLFKLFTCQYSAEWIYPIMLYSWSINDFFALLLQKAVRNPSHLTTPLMQPTQILTKPLRTR